MAGAELDDRTYDLLFSIRRSVRYHMRRRRFYEIWNTATVTVALLGGSATAAFVLFSFSNLYFTMYLTIGLPALVTFVSSIDLAVGTCRKGNEHGDLARRFNMLEQEFASGENLDDETHERLSRRRLEIEASEPPVLRLLDVMCHYDVLRSLGGPPEKQPKVPPIRLWAMHVLSQNVYAKSMPVPE